MSESIRDLERQATVLAYYFVQAPPDTLITQLYIRAVSNGLPEHVDAKDQRLVNFGFSHPKLLPMLDGGLAMLRPNAELRRRIYIMFAILESMPQHSDLFLSKQRSPLYVLVIAAIGVRSVARALSGALLIKALGI